MTCLEYMRKKFEGDYQTRITPPSMRTSIITNDYPGYGFTKARAKPNTTKVVVSIFPLNVIFLICPCLFHIPYSVYLFALIMGIIGYFVAALFYLYYSECKRKKREKQFYDELGLNVRHVDLNKKRRK